MTKSSQSQQVQKSARTPRILDLNPSSPLGHCLRRLLTQDYTYSLLGTGGRSSLGVQTCDRNRIRIAGKVSLALQEKCLSILRRNNYPLSPSENRFRTTRPASGRGKTPSRRRLGNALPKICRAGRAWFGLCIGHPTARGKFNWEFGFCLGLRNVATRVRSLHETRLNSFIL